MNRKGQSLLEFLIFFPVLISMSSILLKIHTAIQLSINAQKSSRAHAFFLFMNSSWYPAFDFRFGDRIEDRQIGEFVIGTSSNWFEEGENRVEPESFSQSILRSGLTGGSNDPQSEPTLRGNVRVRNTMTFCKGLEFVPGSNGYIHQFEAGNISSYEPCLEANL